MKDLGALCLILLLLLVGPAMAREEVSTKRVRVLYLGDAWIPPIRVVLDWIESEPKFGLSTVPCDPEFLAMKDIVRYTRLYLPRSYQSLNETCDIVVLHNIPPRVVSGNTLAFFSRGVEKQGIGLALISFIFWGGTNEIEAWIASTFYGVFPADVDTTTDVYGYMGKTYYTILQRDPIFNLPGIDDVPMIGSQNHGGDIFARPGSTIHASWKGRGTPVLVTGAYGKGNTLQLGHGWHNIPMHSLAQYEYMADYIYNQLYFIADVPPPQDLQLVHRARRMLIQVRSTRTWTSSIIEFAERFGASTREIGEGMARLDLEVDQARRWYMEGDHDKVTEILGDVIHTYDQLAEESLELREEAMMWIFLAEYLAVTGTCLISGATLYTLMIRRKLYREAGQTRGKGKRKVF